MQIPNNFIIMLVIPEKIKNKIQELIYLIVGSITTVENIQIQKEGSQLRVTLDVENSTPLLEENSQLLRSIQHIIRVLVHKQYPEDKTHFFLDVSNYRKERERVLSIKVPELTQNKVLKEGKTVILINLTSYERLLVHQMLLGVKCIETTSVGNIENRKLLILPSSDVGFAKFEDAIIFDLNIVRVP